MSLRNIYGEIYSAMTIFLLFLSQRAFILPITTTCPHWLMQLTLPSSNQNGHPNPLWRSIAVRRINCIMPLQNCAAKCGPNYAQMLHRPEPSRYVCDGLWVPKRGVYVFFIASSFFVLFQAHSIHIQVNHCRFGLLRPSIHFRIIPSPSSEASGDRASWDDSNHPPSTIASCQS